jgi:signal transduction histidine kinase
MMSPEDLPAPRLTAEAKARPRLLVVDDAPDSRLLLARGFERRGFDVVEAEDGQGALALIESQCFDMVLLDVVMPGVSGMEVLRSVRDRHSAVALPIIMVTGRAESDGLAEALKLGANDYLTKPVDMVIAEARVGAHIGRKRADDEARRAFQGMQQAVREAQGANAIKSEFLANMSHEVRTPLNGVLGIADALGRTALNSEQRDLLATIRRSAVTLERLFSDVLDVVGADAGTLIITTEPVDLAAAVRVAAGPWEMQAREKGLNFRLSVDAGAEGVVETDPVRLAQVLGNLLSNAVKFTPAGEVSLAVSRSGGEVLFTVRDTGVGFDDAAKARVFDRFEQGDGSTTRRYGGTGLGLAISRDLAERMGGSLTAPPSRKRAQSSC